MRLNEVLRMDAEHFTARDALEILQGDAKDLASGFRKYIGEIELADDFDEQLLRVAARFQKDLEQEYSTFDNPEGSDEESWVDARHELSMKFLVRHGLARRIRTGV